jgi:hypothetical protein
MEQKICSKCGKCKPVMEFYSKRRKTGKVIRYSQCKACHSEYTKAHYAAHKDVYLDRARKAREVYEARIRSFLISYLLERPCVDCAERDPVVLQFDHCRGTKVMSVSEMVRRRVPEQRIVAEIEKCDVRCANCHMRKTARQFGWWHLGLAPIAQWTER